jgi:large subunit ribosomal protein L24
MKKKYSAKWQTSKQPRKQRKYRYNAPLHRRQKMMSSHLAKDLRLQYKKRSIGLRKGDEVKIMKGEHRGSYGKVEFVSLAKLKVQIENIKAKKTSGQEVPINFDPSNLLVVKLGSDDKKRFVALRRAGKR